MYDTLTSTDIQIICKGTVREKRIFVGSTLMDKGKEIEAW